MNYNQVVSLIETHYDKKTTRSNYKSAIKQLYKFLPNFDAINKPQEILDALVRFNDGAQGHIVNVLRKLTGLEIYKNPVIEIRDRRLESYKSRAKPISLALDIDSLRLKFKNAKGMSESEKLLYTLLLDYPTLRRNDYFSVKFKDYNPNTDNYYDRKLGRFVFNTLVKVPLKPGTQHFILLNKSDKTRFNRFKGSCFISGALSKWEKRIKEINKTVFGLDYGISIFRKITYTEFSPEFFIELNRFLKIAMSQNHTLGTIMTYYLRTF